MFLDLVVGSVAGILPNFDGSGEGVDYKYCDKVETEKGSFLDELVDCLPEDTAAQSFQSDEGSLSGPVPHLEGTTKILNTACSGAWLLIDYHLGGTAVYQGLIDISTDTRYITAGPSVAGQETTQQCIYDVIQDPATADYFADFFPDNGPCQW